MYRSANKSPNLRYKQVAEQVSREIQDGTLPPGTEISETYLKNRFVSSNNTARESIVILARDGYIRVEEIRKNRRRYFTNPPEQAGGSPERG